MRRRPNESGLSLGTVKDFESGRHQLNAKALGDLGKSLPESRACPVFRG
jgi:hypothetical protein